MSMSSGSMPNISGDHTGMPMPSMHALGVGAWASEIQMLRVLRAVADITGLPLQELAVKRRTQTLAEIAAAAGVPRDSVLAVIAAALRSGEPIGGLWHQHDTAQREAVRLIDERTTRKSPKRVIVIDDHDDDTPDDTADRDDHQAGSESRPAPTERDEHGFDREGHLDIRA